MTKRKARSRWKAAIRKWQNTLLLGGYALTLIYDKPKEGVSELPSGGWQWVASTETKPMYLQARITVSDDFLKDATVEEINVKAAHELTHVLLGQYDDLTKTLIEELPKAKREGYWDWRHRVVEFTTTHVARVAGSKGGS